MEAFTGASKVKIGNANFSSVGRDQYNDCTIHQAIVETRVKKKINEDLRDLSQFTEIKRGDIYKNKDVCYSWRLCSNGKDDTEAAVYIAQIMIAGRLGDSKFTVKTYRGRNAAREWRRDFSRCSKDWLRDIPLFGYNQSSVPSLIFCGELIPLAHLDGRLGGVALYYISLLRSSLGCSRNELWMDPTQGRFCRGPIGPNCRFWKDQDVDIMVPSDVEFLKQDVFIRYLTGLGEQADLWFLGVLNYTSRAEKLRVEDIPATNHPQVTSRLTNSTIAFSENARWWTWESCRCLDTEQTRADGATRFRLIDGWRKIELESISEQYSWLSQALSVFHAHNISLDEDEDLSNYKLVWPHFKLTGTLQKSKRKHQRRELLPTPIYLIFLPSHFPAYHWSFDPTGQTPLSPKTCKYLGLPFKLSLKIDYRQDSWPTKIYKVLNDYQNARRLDPRTTDFTLFLRRFPIFKVIPAENRFQEIVEENVPLPLVNARQRDSEPVPESKLSDDNNHQGKDQSPDESDEPLSLELLFEDIQAEGSTYNAKRTNTILTRKRTKRSMLGALFTPLIRGIKYLRCIDSNEDACGSE
ncbi:hypothetical protein E1B28_011720 [Marasmius oreades]|uniref:Uncharacterized protein n=1 Tax=Marasmius oreades TaxID=181124 RepID=A0A9P7UQ92_9AGAR|nr:uncharacterized protein E1B28_011720 [Marasmius oreades]KAG7090108.1 hypothetical protein E1B28_011720 [Marasmius oreades]